MLSRTGTLAGAAARLGIDATTVSRRLRAIERDARRPLLDRPANGSAALDETGSVLAARAERMERHADAASDLLGTWVGAAGAVRPTVVPFVLNRSVDPRLSSFAAAHLVLELILLAGGLSFGLRSLAGGRAPMARQ